MDFLRHKIIFSSWNKIPNELKQFYSSNAYTVLEVSPNDDFKTIKETYRTLIKEYHTDKIMMTEPEKFKLYTEIPQKVNSAYEKLKKIHTE